MSNIFKAWPKTPRLHKDMIVTEKIDGTNAAIVIKRIPVDTPWSMEGAVASIDDPETGGDYLVYAQSRKRLIQPGKGLDNAGFAQWVSDNAESLIATLGEGYHYGEWWGQGINRNYGLTEKRFSLFNVVRYAEIVENTYIPGLHTVPVLHEGPFDTADAQGIFEDLLESGSVASPGFLRPEGVIVFHTASHQVYKITDNGDMPKWMLAAA